MNILEFKEWFFSGKAQTQAHVWSEVEKMLLGTNKVETFLIENKIESNQDYTQKKFPVEDEFLVELLDLTNKDLVLKELDAGNFSDNISGRGHGRFIYLDNDWWAVCTGIEKPINSDIIAKYKFTNREHVLRAITKGWRIKVV